MTGTTMMIGMTTMKTDSQWADAQKHEAKFWGNCLNIQAWHEFIKQEQSGHEMCLFADYGVNGELDMRGKSVLDIGGGPMSMTLRCFNASKLTVVDPLSWPEAVLRRYRNYGIEFVQCAGENLSEASVMLADEVWIYNVLQHVVDPNTVLIEAQRHICPGGRLRVFEWIDIPADKCHLHVLTPELLMNGLIGMRVLKLGLPWLTGYWTPEGGARAFAGVFSP